MKKGLVIQTTGSWVKVLHEGEVYECKVRGKFRIKGIKSTNPVAVGDEVVFEMNEEGYGLINEIGDRKNYIIRKSVNLSKQIHILAANIDRCFLVVTIEHPYTSQGFIDRALVSAEAYRIPVTIIFNKIDLLSNDELDRMISMKYMYEDAGYDVIETSVEKGYHIDMVRERMKDKTSVFIGHSGVGKSSLVNVVDEALNQKIGAISDVHKSGKHTTTFAEMFSLSFGGFIIDSPGIKGLGLVDVEKSELGHYFPEIREQMNGCKFNNCIHYEEPNCAVKLAVEEGIIDERRYASYLNILLGEEEDNRYRKDIYGG